MNIIVNGIVSSRDFQPYVQIMVGGTKAQLTMAQARSVARDIEVQCGRAEADAMLHRFFSKNQYPEGARAALMIEFREFRSQLDAEQVEKSESDPDV